MAKFEAKIYVLQSEWETRWVTIDANSEKEAKRFTRGTMPLTLVLEDDKELEVYQEARKGMRGIKHIDFEVREDV